MPGLARQAFPVCGVDQFQTARWITFTPPGSIATLGFPTYNAKTGEISFLEAEVEMRRR